MLKDKYYTYLLFIVATFISNVGSGFTQAVVYCQLSKASFNPFYYTIAFILAVIPALIGSYVGKRWAFSNRYNVLLCLTQCFAALGIFSVVILSFQFKHIVYILFCEFVTSFVTGISIPILQRIIKLTFKDDKLYLAAKIDAYLFTAQIIFGLGLGTIILAVVQPVHLLYLDILTYLFASILFLLAKPVLPYRIDSNKEAILKQPINWSGFSLNQKRAFLAFPLLMIIGGPATSLLPTLGSKFDPFGFYLISQIEPTNLIIFSRAIGQLLGPLMLTKKHFEIFSKKDSVLIVIIFSFFLTYQIILCASNFQLVLFLIIVAHTLSNIMYSFSFYLLLSQFNSDEIAPISAYQYQLNQILLSAVTLLSGYIATIYSPRISISLFTLLGLLMFLLLTKRNILWIGRKHVYISK